MSNNPPLHPHPTVKRRLISMVYESLLGLAVLFLPLLLLEIAMQASLNQWSWYARQVLAFAVLGIYFIHQWTRDGQTLAMQTWRIKLVRPGYTHLPRKTAVLRFLLSWMWIAPAGVLCLVLDLHKWDKLSAFGIGILLWAMTAFLDKDRQFLHDKLIGTRLVQLPAPVKKKT